MDDVVVFKAAHHVDDGVHLPDVGEELVAQALALAGAAHQPGDVHKFNGRGRVFFRMVHLRELVQPLVRDRHHADIRLNGAEWIVCGLRARIGNRVKQGAFADVRQAHDS